MPKLVVGVFKTRQDVSLLIADLQEEGIKTKDISVIAKDFSELDKIAEDTGLKEPESGTAGTSIFGVLRGLSEVLEGARGEANAVGPAAKPAAGAELWGNNENLAVPLIGAGVPETDAKVYHDLVGKGHFLVLVQCEGDQAHQVNERMNEHDSLSLEV